ncbi:hypothetical protein [Kutzneria sp. CA-103260]|uniref:hypothetical protein n=1 Tax=Kutzneria sp. CA-103260 TaxID=2802641 RepID=UPI001BA447D7|nr:hypothetical protein [Kutzneria sp. CA-103260]
MAVGATYLMVRDTAARGLQWTAFVSVLGAWIPFLLLHRSLRKTGLFDPTTWLVMALVAGTVQVFIGISPAVVYGPGSISVPAYVIGFALDAAAVVLAVTARVVLLNGRPRELAETPFTVVWKLRSRPKGTVELENTRLYWSISTPVSNNSDASASGRFFLGDLTATPSAFAPAADPISWTVVTSRRKRIPANTTPGPAVMLRGSQGHQQIPLDESDELVDFVQRRVAFYREAAPEFLSVKPGNKDRTRRS